MSTEEARAPLIAQETELDHKVSAAPEATPTESDALGLALSGGGVRAALFSLGVVIGLIETGCHRRVRCVASVSGGSILNAVLAHARSLGSFSTVKEFEPLASRLAASLAWQGAFAFDWRSVAAALWYLARVVGRAIVPLVLAFAFLAPFLSDMLRKYLNIDLSHLDYSKVPWQSVGWIALASVLLSVLLSRGLLQEAKFASLLGAVGASGPVRLRLYVKDWGATTVGDGPGVMHVLVATDLLSGEPMYFSSQFVHCRPYGWSTPEKIGTAEALYSSAAFPGGFPPKKLRLRRLRFQNGEMPGALPRIVRLADGGVFNNLGTDWFGVLETQSQATRPLLWPFGELKVDPPRIETDNVIVVNASAPSRRIQRLGPFTLARIMSVLYDNTVRPRVKSLRGEYRPLIDIEESPVQLAMRLAGQPGEAGRRHRAEALAMKLERDDQFWADFSRDTAGTKTKLSRAGRRTAARLMLHGYLLSLVLLHVRFEAKLPEQIRGEEYFLDLVPRPWSLVASPSVANKPAVETTATVDRP